MIDRITADVAYILQVKWCLDLTVLSETDQTMRVQVVDQDTGDTTKQYYLTYEEYAQLTRVRIQAIYDLESGEADTNDTWAQAKPEVVAALLYVNHFQEGWCL